MTKTKPANARILRVEPRATFPHDDVVAVLDQVQNVVLLNDLWAGDDRWFRRALFMTKPVMMLAD